MVHLIPPTWLFVDEGIEPWAYLDRLTTITINARCYKMIGRIMNGAFSMDSPRIHKADQSHTRNSDGKGGAIFTRYGGVIDNVLL